jgi:DNA-binding GntR family transcriptional regulator
MVDGRLSTNLLSSPAMARTGEAAIARSTLTRQIYELLLNRLLNGSLRPGERLVEAEIAASVGTSRGPVREAIGLLQRDGLVRADPFVGASIIDPDDGEMVEIYYLRSVMEGYAASLVTQRRTTDQIAELKAITTRMRETHGPRTTTRLRQLDAQFHGTLVQLADDQQLWQMWNRMRSQVALYLSTVEEAFTDGERLARMHDPIVDAILSGDAVEAERRVRAQLISNASTWTAEKVHRRGRGADERQGGPEDE